MGGLGIQVLYDLLVIVGLTLPIRLLILRRHRRLLTPAFFRSEKSFFALPRSEFLADGAIWILNGILIGFFMHYFRGVPVLSGIISLVGCLVLGLLVGILNYLEMEKEVIGFLRESPTTIAVHPRLALSVTRKTTILLVFMMVVSSLVIAALLFGNIRFLMMHRMDPGMDSFYSAFYDVGFVTVVLLAFGVAITSRFSRNLKILFDLQITTLEKVGAGSYDSDVPIVTQDEFGIIAARTNEMISGLKERDFIRETFGRYVTKEISDMVLEGKIPLEGEQRTVTIMFCDIRSYTSYVESTDPNQVVGKINQYFTEMTEAIRDEGGVVLQFLGDEIYAVFGAPLDRADHPEAAVKAALAMRERLARLNKEWERVGGHTFKHGIGIHTGDVLAGNIGSPDRLSYLMVGDTVNLASRMQGLTKKFGWDVLISGETWDAITNGFDIEFVSRVRMKGKEQETDVFKVL
jgi:class 3 adenylate cyclase